MNFLLMLSPLLSHCFPLSQSYILTFLFIYNSQISPSKGFDEFSFNPQFVGGAFLSESKCFRRIQVPHFMVKDYTILQIPEELNEGCFPLDARNELRPKLDIFGDDFRLPKTILPHHYLVKLCPQTEIPFNFTGTVEIELEVQEPTQEITLNTLDLEIHSATLWLFKLPKTKIRSAFNINNHLQNITVSRRINDKFYDLKHKFYNKYANKSELYEYPPKNSLDQMKKKTKFTIKENEKQKHYLTITKMKIDKALQRITFTASEVLEYGNLYKLKIAYSGHSNHYLTGLYNTFHFDKNFTRKNSLITQFQVSEARKVFPCFDEPFFRASFTLILCRKRELKAISNMPKIATLPRKGHPGMVWDLFRSSVPMATYLIAFAVLDDFGYVLCNHTYIPFKVWGPNPVIEKSEFACSEGPRLLDFFIEYFQANYPLPKMDLVAVPQFFAYGMENWGLVTFILDRLLIDLKAPSAQEKQHRSMETISHEMAHQWFGNLVTPSWWSDIWLNEGFATFLSLLGVEHVRPSWQKMKEYIVTVLHRVMAKDAMESSHAIVQDVSHPRDFFALFDDISYGKGCFIVRMMMHILTKEVFQRALQEYLRKMRFKSATQSDLWGFMTRAGHDSGTLWRNLTISEVMEPWLVQKGYPIVSARRMQDGSLQVTQMKHYREPDEENQATVLVEEFEGPMWWIPLSFASKLDPNMSDTSPKFWMNEKSHIIHPNESLAADDWFLLNLQHAGYFRVNYDTSNWGLISRELWSNPETFDEMTRVQLLDDAFSLAYSDKIDFGVPMSVASYLNKESSPFVIATALENLHPILDAFSHDALFGEFKDFFLEIMSSHYPPQGVFRTDKPRSKFVKDLQITVVKTMCKFYEPCINQSRGFFQRWMQDPTDLTDIEEDLLGTILCTSVSEGNEVEWDFIWEVFNSGRLECKQEELLSALTCSRHLWLSSRLLLVLSVQGSLHEGVYQLNHGLEGIAKNPVSTELAWQYLKALWPRYVGNTYEDVYFEAVVPHLRTEAQIRDLINFVNSPEMGGSKIYKGYIEETVKNVQRKVDFMTRNYPELISWFSERGKKR